MQDCKPDIVAATAACEEVKKSRKLAKILEIILLIGNIMNTGSKNAQAVGFDISYLPKLSNTKVCTILELLFKARFVILRKEPPHFKMKGK